MVCLILDEQTPFRFSLTQFMIARPLWRHILLEHILHCSAWHYNTEKSIRFYSVKQLLRAQASCVLCRCVADILHLFKETLCISVAFVLCILLFALPSSRTNGVWKSNSKVTKSNFIHGNLDTVLWAKWTILDYFLCCEWERMGREMRTEPFRWQLAPTNYYEEVQCSSWKTQLFKSHFA